LVSIKDCKAVQDIVATTYLRFETKISIHFLLDDPRKTVGSPGEIRTLVSGSRARHAWPLHHRAFFGSVKKAFQLPNKCLIMFFHKGAVEGKYRFSKYLLN
jgi:hypothetical protein